jgi:uncharacterized protein (UPF0261 family)
MPVSSTKKIVIIGCFDSKGVDFAFLYNCLKSESLELITINTGVLGSSDLLPINYEADRVAAAAGEDLANIRERGDRSEALTKMSKGAAKILAGLTVDGIIGMGGGGGTYLFIESVKNVPIGIPKLCLSTLATKDLSSTIGGKDITLMPSIVDVAGLNKISERLISQAAGAIIGMVNAPAPPQRKTEGSIAMSIFGNTTKGVNYCADYFKQKAFDVLTFHAVGIGGKTMEDLIEAGYFDAVLDMTTTELADNLCGGICDAGPDRLTAAGKAGIPQVVIPGCLDMVNFGALDTVPIKYQSRKLFSWAPDVTLMRTNIAENETLGKLFAEKLNQSKGSVAVLIPLRGISIISQKGEIFYDPAADKALFESIKKHLNPQYPIIEMDTHINDEAFAQKATKILLDLINQ